MSAQREKDAGVALAVVEQNILGRPLQPGEYVGGGMIENFRKGWAHIIMPPGQKRAHYFIRDGFDKVIALCGVEGDARWVYGAGNLPECERCIEKRCKR